MEAVLQRLEAATTRLENLVSNGNVASQTSATSTATSAVSSSGSDSPSLKAFDDLRPALDAFTTASNSIDSLVAEQSKLVGDAFCIQRSLIELASKSKKPATMTKVIEPLQQAIQAIISVKEKNRASKFFNHLSVVAEGIPALGWVVVEPTPAPYASDMKDASQFYVNRVIKEFKGKDEAQISWANLFLELLTQLCAYVKKWHTTGLVWNPKGADVSAAAPPPAATPTPEKTTAPPKPPGGLLSALNKDNLTAGLRKVEKSEMAHKNPELRASGVVKSAESPAPKAPAGGPKPATPKGPPKTQLEGNKWVVENHMNNNEVVIEKPEIRHVIYIYNCQNSTIQIKGKVNAVTLDNCKKVGLVVENAVSTVDIVNCKSCKLQITGKAPTVVVDKTDGLQIYLSRDGLACEILTAKSSEMNVVFEDPNTTPGTADFLEKPVSEQFKTKIVNGELVTTCVEHKG